MVLCSVLLAFANVSWCLMNQILWLLRLADCENALFHGKNVKRPCQLNFFTLTRLYDGKYMCDNTFITSRTSLKWLGVQNSICLSQRTVSLLLVISFVQKNLPCIGYFSFLFIQRWAQVTQSQGPGFKNNSIRWLQISVTPVMLPERNWTTVIHWVTVPVEAVIRCSVRISVDLFLLVC